MPEKIDTLAKILVRIPEAEQELGIDWTDAAKAKAKAAKWLRKIGKGELPASITVLVEIEQRSDDTTFLDGARWWGKEDVEFSIEYGAKFLESFPNWGRGR